MSDRAKRFNTGKPRFDLIPPAALTKLAQVYQRGASKYTIYERDGVKKNGFELEALPPEDRAGWVKIDCGENNWRKGQNWLSSMASVERHIQSWKAGSDIDELGTYHLANAAWGLLSILEFYEIFPEGDDRNHWFKKPQKRVYWDIDGCLADFEQHFLTYLNLNPEVHANDWDDPRFRDNYKRIKDDNNFWLTMPPLISPDDIDYPISGYCTSRSCPSEVTREWLNKHRFPAADLISIPFGESKVTVLNGKCDVFIDDSIKNFIELQSNGILCYLKTRPHNVKFDVGHFRVNDAKQFLNKVRGLN